MVVLWVVALLVPHRCWAGTTTGYSSSKARTEMKVGRLCEEEGLTNKGHHQAFLTASYHGAGSAALSWLLLLLLDSQLKHDHLQSLHNQKQDFASNSENGVMTNKGHHYYYYPRDCPAFYLPLPHHAHYHVLMDNGKLTNKHLHKIVKEEVVEAIYRDLVAHWEAMWNLQYPAATIHEQPDICSSSSVPSTSVALRSGVVVGFRARLRLTDLYQETGSSSIGTEMVASLERALLNLIAERQIKVVLWVRHNHVHRWAVYISIP